MPGSGNGPHFSEILPCFAHTLQLVVRHGLKSATQTGKNISKASNIVSQAGRLTHYTDLLNGETKLQVANETRWNSQITMIRSPLAILDENPNALPTSTLAQYDRNILKDVISILEPFGMAT